MKTVHLTLFALVIGCASPVYVYKNGTHSEIPNDGRSHPLVAEPGTVIRGISIDTQNHRLVGSQWTFGGSTVEKTTYPLPTPTPTPGH